MQENIDGNFSEDRRTIYYPRSKQNPHYHSHPLIYTQSMTTKQINVVNKKKTN